MAKYILPAGEYYIGDICYALDNKIYEGIWGGNNYGNGKYVCESHNFVVNTTHSGDGYFPSNSPGVYYCVDAGNIGMVHDSLIDKHKLECLMKCGSMHIFTGDVSFEYDSGTFTVDCKTDNFHLVIWTHREQLSSDRQ